MDTASVTATALDVPGEGDRLYEVVNGERVEVPPMGVVENDLATELAARLRLSGPRRTGRALTETLFVLDPENDLQRRPDVAFVSYGRWPRDRAVPSVSAWEVVPDLAVEVISPTNTANEVLTKVRDYLGAGVRLVWVIYPLFQAVYCYTSFTSVAIHDSTGSLDGGDVVPGFRLAVSELFAESLGLPSPEG